VACNKLLQPFGRREKFSTETDGDPNLRHLAVVARHCVLLSKKDVLPVKGLPVISR
jgi:hypothetical protein